MRGQREHCPSYSDLESCRFLAAGVEHVDDSLSSDKQPRQHKLYSAIDCTVIDREASVA
ncbi:MAG: hypothetical protein ACWGOX_06370 [Desulforhopalus sp.]